ncbi:MAG: hypothetical protein HEP71_14195 [Roseivirga sp.]|nr:hypothetical protein [Roseivirga sp.]
MILLGLVIGLIHLPPVQNYIVDEVTTYLTEGTGYQSEIDYTNIRWFNSIVVEGTRIYDHDDRKMIEIDELVLTFDLQALIGKKDIQLDEAWIDGASVNLREEGKSALNIDYWVIALDDFLAPEPSDPPKPFEPGIFGISKITMSNSEFSLSDGRIDSLTTGFDQNHFRLTSLSADLLNLKSVRDTFQIDVKYLTAKDTISGLEIDELHTFFRTSQKGMAFYDLDLKLGQSHIKDSVVFRHEKASDMSDFINKVNISANFDESIIHTKDLSLFAPELASYDEQVELSGYFTGTVRSFFSENFKIAFSDNTRLQGSMDIEGLPLIDETIFDITLNDSRLKSTDLQNYISPQAFSITDKLGLVRLDGDFEGAVYNFVAQGEFRTDIGDFDSNTQIEIEEGKNAKYDGELTMREFDLGLFTEDSIFQKVNMTGTIEGSGFKLEDADFDLDATIFKVGINGYDYKDIKTDGHFAQSFFKGDINVNDPNFTMQASGSVDLRDKKNLFEINGTLTNADMDEIQVTSQQVNLSTDFDIDIQGLKLDSILGDLTLRQTYLSYETEDITIDSLYFSSERSETERSVEFSSEYFKMNMDGNFEFTTLLNELSNINEQYRLMFSSNMKGLNSFLEQNGPSDLPFDIDYTVELKDVTPIINLFDTAIYVAKNGLIEGTFTNNGQQHFILNTKVDTVTYANINFLDNEFDINADNLRDTSNILTIGYFYSKKQVYANTSETDDLTLEAVWDGKHIDLRQNLGQISSGNYAEIGADLDFYPDRTEMRFDASNILALNETWQIAEDNIVVFGEEKITIENLDIYNNNQSINFDGEISVLKDTAKTLQVKFREVEVQNFNPITLKEYTGKINGTLNAQNIYYNPLFFGDLKIDDFRINNFLVGDINGELAWKDLSRKFDLDFTVNRLGKEIITLNGDFFPSNKSNQLDLDLVFNDANLKIAEPYIEDYFTEIGGTLDGRLSVKGKLKKPVLEGKGFIEEAGIKVNYLNTNYLFDGDFEFEENNIKLSNILFADNQDNKADFNGSIQHNYFKNFVLDLDGDLNQFQVLNIPFSEEVLYYGEAYASGTVDITGAANNLSISANASTQPNTKVYIPISKGNETNNNSFIKFIDRTDTTEVKAAIEDEVDKIKIEGLNLDLDIEVTPDAYTEIIIDAKTGDIIRGRGNGQLRLQIDSQGEFNMSGGLDIVQGSYNFSLYNIITKEFDIEQPSRITWYGDPYEGVMDINASKRQITSLDPILTTAGLIDNSSGGVSRRYPTKVKLNLQGALLSPKIAFDIDFSEVNTQDFQLQTALNAFKNKIQSDEQELNRQVLSLIVFNRFSEEGIVNIGGRTASQNVSQLLSNQFSQLAAQLDENLEIDLDLADLTEEAFNTFQLRLSYTFLGGRLRVTREGGVTNLVDVNSIAGDWTAEYLLTPDGRYKVKVYSRNNYDFTQSLISQGTTSTTTGASVTQTTSFNSLKEFFGGVNRNRKKRRKQNTPTTTPPSGSN